MPGIIAGQFWSQRRSLQTKQWVKYCKTCHLDFPPQRIQSFKWSMCVLILSSKHWSWCIENWNRPVCNLECVLFVRPSVDFARAPAEAQSALRNCLKRLKAIHLLIKKGWIQALSTINYHQYSNDACSISTLPCSKWRRQILWRSEGRWERTQGSQCW